MKLFLLKSIQFFCKERIKENNFVFHSILDSFVHLCALAAEE